MRIALFYPHNMMACHYATGGYRAALESMGHEVFDCPFPGNMVNPAVLASVPSIEDLQGCDVILSTYHEYTQPWLQAIYTYPEWVMLMRERPVLARFDESMDRHDLSLPDRVPVLLEWATHYSWPAAQDAKKYGGEFHPYGAEPEIFHPGLEGHVKRTRDIDLGFIGSPYPKRQEYLQKLQLHLPQKTMLHIGRVFVQEIDGMNERASTMLLAHNYRRIKIFFCLPPMSNLLVEKIFDVMACGAMVMYPRLQDEAEANLKVFEDGKEIVYYEYGFFADNGKQVKYYLDRPDEVRRIADAGAARIRRDYRLETLLDKMLRQAVGDKTCDSTPNSLKNEAAPPTE